MRRIFCLINLVLLISCYYHPNLSCVYSSNPLEKTNAKRIFGTSIKNEKIIEYRDKAIDSIKGGYYTFYTNDNLKSYRFFVDMQTYIYSGEYDTLGNALKIEGNPLVHNKVELTYDSSLSIRMYFFSLNKRYDSIQVSTSDNRIINLQLHDDTLFSNMQFAEFNYSHLNKEEDISSYIKVLYHNTCTNQPVHFNDSIVLHYNPYIGR